MRVVNLPPAGSAVSSLVKGAIYPTREGTTVHQVIDKQSGDLVSELVDGGRLPESVEVSGTSVRLSHRGWSGEWRIRCQADTPHGVPPTNTGDRHTSKLSSRAAREIGDSCRYVHTLGHGYRTFITFTLTPEARERIKTPKAQRVLKLGETRPAGHYCNGEQAGGEFTPIKWGWASSIQREISRFWDAASKIHRRGWVPAYYTGTVRTYSDGIKYTPITWNTEKNKEPGTEAPLYYLWVAECPKNAEGEDNPHVHAMMDWRVDHRVFACWVRRLESIYGQGFAHFEKIRNPEATEYYIMKAINYLKKGGQSGAQGTIRGNRYAIAHCARAPAWQPIAAYQWGIMGHLLEVAREKLKEKIEPIKNALNRQREKLRGAPKSAKKLRNKCGQAIMAARKKIKAVGVYIGRHNAVFAGIDQVDKFLTWAERHGWAPHTKPPGLWFGNFLRKMQNWKDGRRIAAVELCAQSWDATMEFFGKYERYEEA